nr:hypothetical protein [Tanacetum cinerariifolium]
MDTDALYNIIKQNQGDVNDAMGSKKKTIVVTSDLMALIAEKIKVSKSKEKVVVSSDSKGSDADDFSELKKITALLSDEKQVVKKVDEKKRDISRVKCYNYKKKEHFAKDCKKAKVKDYEYYKTNMLLAKKDKDEQVLLAEDQVWMESSSDLDQEINANIVFMAQIKKVLSDSEASSSSADEKISEVIGLGYTLMFLTHSDEALEIEKFKRSRENKFEFAYDYGNLNAMYVNEKINFEDDYFQKIINPNFKKIDSPFQQTSSLKPYVLNVILEKIIIDLEDEVVNLWEKEKVNLETIESLKSKDQSENDCLVVEKEYDKEENSKVIAPGMFKLNVSQCVSPILMSKSSYDSYNDEIKLKRKRRKRKSSKQNVKQKKEPFNTSNVGLSAVIISKLNKNVKRYSRKDLLACNNSHLGDTSSASMCNDAMNVSCDSRMNNLLDDNNFFIFDDESVKISPVSKMPFKKKPRDSMNVRSKSVTSPNSQQRSEIPLWGATS